MIELYEFPPTRSQRAKWTLEELEVEYTSKITNLEESQRHTQDYRAIHPLGVVPAIKADNYTIFASTAIVMQLIDEHPEKNLAPDVASPERAKYYQWCVFASAELDPALMMFFDNTMRPLEFMRPPGTLHNPELAKRGSDDFMIRADILSKALSERDYLLGSNFSGADIVVGHNIFMAKHIGLMNDGEFPSLETYYQRLQDRPGYQRVYTSSLI